MSSEITGTVTEVELDAIDNGRGSDVRIKVVLDLGDGRKAYVSTGVGRMRENGYGRELSPAQLKASKEGYPFVILADRGEFIPTLWRGDVVTIKGTVAEKTSARGNAYVTVNRCTIEDWVRPEWAPVVDGAEVVPTADGPIVHEEAPAPIVDETLNLGWTIYTEMLTVPGRVEDLDAMHAEFTTLYGALEPLLTAGLATTEPWGLLLKAA